MTNKVHQPPQNRRFRGGEMKPKIDNLFLFLITRRKYVYDVHQAAKKADVNIKSDPKFPASHADRFRPILAVQVVRQM